MSEQIVRVQAQAALDLNFDAGILAGNVGSNTQRQYMVYFAEYLAFAGSAQAALEPSTLARWRQHLYHAQYQGADDKPHRYALSSINLRLAAVRSVMKQAVEQEYLSAEQADAFRSVPGLSLRVNRERVKPHSRTAISRDQMRDILAQPAVGTLAGKMHRAFMETLAGSGVRVSEAVNLRVGDIEKALTEQGQTAYAIRVLGKNMVEPELRPLSVRAYKAIQQWLKARPVQSDYVFTGFTGRHDRSPSTTPIRPSSAWKMIRRYAAQAGVENVKPHDFRRFVGTQVAKQDIRKAQKVLGHKRIETTARHYILDEPPFGITDDLV